MKSIVVGLMLALLAASTPVSAERPGLPKVEIVVQDVVGQVNLGGNGLVLGYTGLVTVTFESGTVVTVPGYGPSSPCEIYTGIENVGCVVRTSIAVTTVTSVDLPLASLNTARYVVTDSDGNVLYNLPGLWVVLPPVA